MDIKRVIIYIIVAVLAVILFNLWQHDYPPQKVQMASATHSNLSPSSRSSQDNTNVSYTPPSFTPGISDHTRNVAKHSLQRQKVSATRMITVKTDLLDIIIDSHGGNIISAKLNKYPESLQNKSPIAILSTTPADYYVAQTGPTTSGNHPIRYTSAKRNYVLQGGVNVLVVRLTGTTRDGLRVTKIYRFQRDHYSIGVDYQILNRSGRSWTGSVFSQILRRQPSTASHHFYNRSYDGGAISSPQIRYHKLPYKTLQKTPVNENIMNGWIAMQQRYFLSAWIPGNSQRGYHYFSHIIPASLGQQDIFVLGFISPKMTLANGAAATENSTFYVGPEIRHRLAAIAPGLDRTIDYGWLFPISILLFWIMSAIDRFIGNWGWTIMITTFLIKMVFYWFSASSFRSMARMRELQPRMEQLKQRYGDDRQGLSQATMELYRKEKVNPIGGCLPMVIQIPVFIAFYYVIVESVQLRQAPFIFWVHDLSMKDPYYILPILMGVSMLAQQWLSPTSTDPTQQKMMWILPVIFTVFFINFPAGLVLYWLTNNVVQTLQQWYVNKTYDAHKAKKQARRTKRKYRN